VTWKVERWSGSAADFHARPVPSPAEPAIWVFDVDRPALVLGSTQPDSVVDTVACAAAGIDVVRRRSGGGAVFLEPGDAAWIDVIVPSGHPLADPDVGRATWWLGEAWAAALTSLGVADARVHRGAMVSSQWSSLVCFAGLGPGEVTVGGAKAVGISQRRTREAARFQTAAALAWHPERLVPLLSPPLPTGHAVRALSGVVNPIGRPAVDVIDAVLGAVVARSERS